MRTEMGIVLVVYQARDRILNAVSKVALALLARSLTLLLEGRASLYPLELTIVV